MGDAPSIVGSSTESRPLRALIVEDSQFDAAVLANILTVSGYDADWTCVDTLPAFVAALAQDEPWDVILSDYNLPSFKAPDALRELQNSGLDIPFIIISGGIGEDTAVAAMKAGAHDYLMKGQLTRLVPAVEREVSDARSRRAAREAEAQRRDIERRYRLLWEHSTDAVVLFDGERTVKMINPAALLASCFTTHAPLLRSASRFGLSLVPPAYCLPVPVPSGSGAGRRRRRRAGCI